MKLLVFAHIPPPHHGQSYMVQLMLNGFGGDARKRKPGEVPANDSRIECYHVNACFSKKLEDIGEFQAGKLIRILWYCFEAIWCRFRYDVTHFYYVPAPGKRSAVYRDWLVMLVCRPFFKHVILHWHAAGLGKWLETVAQMRARSIMFRALGRVDLSIVLSKYNIADAEKLLPHRYRIVSNGIPDPCPSFVSTVLPARRARFANRTRLLSGDRSGPRDSMTVTVLYMAHCTREKGMFDAAEAVVRANRILSDRKLGVRLSLLVAGSFVTDSEKAEFQNMLQDPAFSEAVSYLGFIMGAEKERLMTECDLFCFPTFYTSENEPVNLIEAMAFGLPVITTHWRSLPEMLPPGYPGLVKIKSPDQLAETLLAMLNEDGEALRENFLNRFTLQRHLKNLAGAMLTTDDHPDAIAATPGSPANQILGAHASRVP